MSYAGLSKVGQKQPPAPPPLTPEQEGAQRLIRATATARFVGRCIIWMITRGTLAALAFAWMFLIPWLSQEVLHHPFTGWIAFASVLWYVFWGGVFGAVAIGWTESKR